MVGKRHGYAARHEKGLDEKQRAENLGYDAEVYHVCKR